MLFLVEFRDGFFFNVALVYSTKTTSNNCLHEVNKLVLVILYINILVILQKYIIIVIKPLLVALVLGKLRGATNQIR